MNGLVAQRFIAAKQHRNCKNRKALAMTTVQPEGDLIRKAVKWISDELQDHPDEKRNKLLEQASVKFNLSPKDFEYLQKLILSEQQ